MDRATFEARRDEGGFVEWAEVAGNLYGTPALSAPPGDDLLLEIDVQGAEQILAQHPDALMILIVAPSRDVQRARLEGRGDPEDVIATRLAISDREERAGRALAHHVVVNDDLERAVGEVAGILARYRRSPQGA